MRSPDYSGWFYEAPDGSVRRLEFSDESFRLTTKGGRELSLEEALRFGEFWMLEDECPMLDLAEGEVSPLVSFLREELE